MTAVDRDIHADPEWDRVLRSGHGVVHPEELPLFGAEPHGPVEAVLDGAAQTGRGVAVTTAECRTRPDEDSDDFAPGVADVEPPALPLARVDASRGLCQDALDRHGVGTDWRCGLGCLRSEQDQADE